jgi:hypothetical protein
MCPRIEVPVLARDLVLSAFPEVKAKRKRRSRTPAGPAGARLVRDELLRRGFDAQLSDSSTNKYDLFVGLVSPPKPVHVRTVHVGPWYVRSSHFVGAAANQVTVYVLLGFEKNPHCARFFVTRNGDMETRFRQPPNWGEFGFIDVEAVEQYEDNWDLLKA